MPRVARESVESSKVLHCQNGNHKWETVKSRGKYPKSCPDHAKVIVAEHRDAMQEGKARKNREDREAKIREIVKSYSDCECGIEPGISDEDLYWMKGCRESFICPTLVRVRNAVGLHNVDSTPFWYNRFGKRSS